MKVCRCNDVKEKEVIKCIEKGATSLTEIMLATGAMKMGKDGKVDKDRSCCRKKIKKLIEAYGKPIES